jgi:hypothetical protein
VFAAIVATVIVAVSTKWLSMLATESASRPTTQPAVDQPDAERAFQTGSAPSAPHPITQPEPPPSPRGVMHLVTPHLSDHFYTFGFDPVLERNERKATVDPGLFQFQRGRGVVIVPGSRLALLTTKEEYKDFTLHLGYKWGEKTWGPGEGKARRAAILLYITGPDGGFVGNWPQCVAVSLGEGEAGTIRLMGTPGRITCTARVKESPDRFRRDYVGRDSPRVPQTSGQPPAWNGTIYRLGFPTEIQDVQGWHPEGDPTLKPPYQPDHWNRLRIDFHNETITVHINQKLVNEITGLNLKQGRIAFASQLAEWHIGWIDLELD